MESKRNAKKKNYYQKAKIQKAQKEYENKTLIGKDQNDSDEEHQKSYEAYLESETRNIKLQQIVSELMKQPSHKLNTCLNFHQPGKRDIAGQPSSGKTINIQTFSSGPILQKIQSMGSSQGSAINENQNQTEITATITSSSTGKNGHRNYNRGKNQSNPIIFESTTTMHTTTKTTVKVNNRTGDGGTTQNNIFESNMDFLHNEKLAEKLRAERTEYFKRMFESGYPCFKNGFIDSQDILEDMDPRLGELIYTDQMPTNPKEIDKKSKWVQEAYGPLAEKSSNKTQLLQLIEYNKIAINENDAFIEQRTEIEIVICKLMRQRIMNDELKIQVENHHFQGLETEQQSLVYSVIKLTKKNIHTLYKKCQNFTMTKEVNSDIDRKRVLQVYVKDLLQAERDYIDMVRKMVDLYDEMIKKAQYFRTTTAKIFDTQPGFKFMDNESIIKGFFFMFIYKDFVLREIVQLMNELLKAKLWRLIDCVDQEYQKFMESELVEWTNLMLSCGVFQSFSSIVTPNQNQYQQYKSKSSGNKIILPTNEGQNFFDFNSLIGRRHQQMLIDSDYDVDDEDINSEMDEIFSISAHQSDDEGEHDCVVEEISYQDSDDEYYKQIDQRFGTKGAEHFLKSDISKEFQEKYKQLLEADNMIDPHFLKSLQDCDPKLSFPSLSHTFSSSSQKQNYAYNMSNLNNSTLYHQMQHQDFDNESGNELSNQASTNETLQTQEKKKKKRRKNKKKKKKKSGEEGEQAATGEPCCDDVAGNGSASRTCKMHVDQQQHDSNNLSHEDQDDSAVDDPEFEEDLKQFQMRLMLCNQSFSSAAGSSNGRTPFRKLKPNVTSDWLLAVREKSKSLSQDNYRMPSQLTLVA